MSKKNRGTDHPNSGPRVMPVRTDGSLKAQGAQGGFVPATSASNRRTRQTANAVAGADSSSSVGGQYSRNSGAYKARKGGSSRAKTVVVVLVILALIAALGATAAYAYKETRKSEINADLHSMDKLEQQAVDAELTGLTEFDKPFTVLLLGSDEREDDPEMGARTDTIILARVDPVENTVSLVSIPRDTMVQIEGAGTNKMNATYFYGGPSGTIAAVKDLCGIEIDHYAQVNFENMVSLVDAIGGIDVYVDETIDDPEGAQGYIEAGQQHLDGENALVLARSRQFADGDYTRQVNQRKVILAIIEKALKAPAAELTGLIQASTKFVTTDSGIDFDFIYSLADQMRHNEKEVTITSTTLPSQPAYIGDVSYVIADKAGIAELMQIFESGKPVDVEITSSSISADIAAAGASTTSSSANTAGDAGAVYQ